MDSSQSRRDKERSEPSPEQQPPRTPGDDDLDPFPTSSPLTPEGYIEGIGSFAQGLKRMLRRWRHR